MLRFVLLLAIIAVVVWLVRRFFIARNQSDQTTAQNDSERARLTKLNDDGQRIDCPRCAERIRREAAVCRYCGHDLTTSAR